MAYEQATVRLLKLAERIRVVECDTAPYEGLLESLAACDEKEASSSSISSDGSWQPGYPLVEPKRSIIRGWNARVPLEVGMLIRDVVELGALIRRRRVERRLSQTELGELSGVTRQWISRLEQGRNDVGIARLLAVLDALELNLDVRSPPSGILARSSDGTEPSLIPTATLQALSQWSTERTHPMTGLSPDLEAAGRRILEASTNATARRQSGT